MQVSIDCDAEGVLCVAGELSRTHAADFRAELATAAGAARRPLIVDLFEFDLDDALATVAAVAALRSLAEHEPLVVRHAPQLLAHSLYRINALGTIRLEAPREEEPYG